MSPSPPRSSRALRSIDPAWQERETRLGWRMAGAGMQTASEVAGGVALGWVVDHFAGTAPWGLLVGGCVGIVVALVTLLRIAWKMNQELDSVDAARKTGGTARESVPGPKKDVL